MKLEMWLIRCILEHFHAGQDFLFGLVQVFVMFKKVCETKTAARRPPLLLFSAFFINYRHSAARAMRTSLITWNSSNNWIVGAKPSA